MILKWETATGEWAYFGNAQAIFVDNPKPIPYEELSKKQMQPLGDTRVMLSVGRLNECQSDPYHVRRIHFLFDGKDAELWTSNAVWLLNDVGKTVERIN